MCKALCLFCEDRSKEIKLLFLFKRDLNLKGRLKQKGEQEKDGWMDRWINGNEWVGGWVDGWVGMGG